MKNRKFFLALIFSLFLSLSYSQDTNPSKRHLLFEKVPNKDIKLFWVLSEGFLFGIANGQRKILVPPLYKQKQIKIKGNHIRIYTKQGVENLVFNTKGEIIDRFKLKQIHSIKIVKVIPKSNFKFTPEEEKKIKQQGDFDNEWIPGSYRKDEIRKNK